MGGGTFMLGFLFGGIVMAAIVVISSVAFSSRGARGEKAKFVLKLNSDRTSPNLQEGTIETYVSGQVIHTPDGRSFIVQVYYEFHLWKVGQRIGTFEVEMPWTYYSGRTVWELRAQREANFSHFRAEHVGIRDVTVEDDFFGSCDIVTLTDVANDDLLMLLQDLLQLDSLRVDLPTDIRITVALSGLAPALQVVQIDVVATVGPDTVRAGFDLSVDESELLL